jgi:hypothetical protein
VVRFSDLFVVLSIGGRSCCGSPEEQAVFPGYPTGRTGENCRVEPVCRRQDDLPRIEWPRETPSRRRWSRIPEKSGGEERARRWSAAISKPPDDRDLRFEVKAKNNEVARDQATSLSGRTYSCR